MSTTTKKVKRLTAAEKARMRIVIAKDVIKQLEAGLTVTPERSIYCDIPSLYKANESDELMKHLDTECFGCALGAMFLAHVRRYDRLKVSDGFDGSFCYRSIITPPLRKYFTDSQLGDIEAAYEGFSRHLQYYDIHPGLKTEDRTARLIAICKNLIRNKGTFMPEKETAQ